MRVHYLSRRFYPDLYGGIEVSGWELVKHWHASGVGVDITAENYPDGSFRTDDVLPGVRCTRIPTAGRGRLWRVAPAARVGRWAARLACHHPGDVAVAAHPECAVASKLARPGRPLLYRLIAASEVAAAATGGQPPRVLRWVERLAAGVADRVVVESRHVADQATRTLHVPAARVSIVPTGINLARFATPAPAVGAAVPPDGFRVVCVGRLHHEKGADFLLDAVARMRHRERTWVLLVGDGPEREALGRQAVALGLAARVLFPGRVADPERFLAAADALVLPSRYESYGTALVEGMAAGLPCLGRRPDPPRVRVACPDHIGHGVTGFLVDPHDPADLAARLDDLAADPVLRGRMGAAGRAAARERYSLDAMAARYLELLRGLTGFRTSSPRNHTRPTSEV